MTLPMRRSGFTLLEMAIVLTIIGLITAMGITSGIGALEAAKRTQTENKLNYIEEALQSFRNDNHRLPCPADATLVASNSNYGVEAATPGTCTGGTPSANFGPANGVVEGAVPVQALNLPNEYMYDGWGRKFAYAVDTNMTDLAAFDTSLPPDMCGITINDASESPRSSGAIYTLVSFGPDGHGGFLQTGARNNAGLNNADALTNCHCTDTGSTGTYSALYVDKQPVGTQGTVSSFDNIVHFKERWQLLNYDDQLNFSADNWYFGPRVLAGFQSGGSDSAYLYKLQCGRLQKQSGLLSPVAANYATGVVFTPNNNYMLVFSSAGCALYPITYGGLLIGTGSVTSAGDTSNTLPVPDCPAYDTGVKVAMSANGYLAISSNTPPYIQVWQQSGNIFTAMGAFTSPGSEPTSLSLTNNYMLISNNLYMKMYGRSGGSYSLLGTQPISSMPGGSVVYSSTIAPNEAYFAATVNGTVGGSPAPQIYLWKITGTNTFSAISGSPIGIVGDDAPAGITFSPDGKYMAVGGADGDNMVLYKIDTNDAFNRLNAPSTSNWTSAPGTAGIGFAFSNDSRYIAMITASSSKPLVLFRRTDALDYKYATVPDSPPGMSAASVAFSN